MACFDLAELDQLVGPRRMLSDHRWASISFPRNVHLRHATGSLDCRVRDFVQQETGQRPSGRIRLLTQLRYFGFYFSPLNLFFLDNEDSAEAFPRQIVAEVNNTPWGEQHAYLLEPQWNDTQQAWTYEHSKQMHVSPFMPMDQRYRWTFPATGDSLALTLENLEQGHRVFHAGMNLEKKPLTKRMLQRFLSSVPPMSMKAIAAIYYEAWKLWSKRCPIFPHPQSLTTSAPAAQAPKST